MTQRVTDTATGEWDVLTRSGYIVVIEPRVITYTYDGLYRLTEADYSSGERFQYAYDAVSNMTAMTETISTTVVTTYTHNATYQLVTAKSGDDGVTWHYTYDGRGNLVRQTPGGTEPAEGETRYTYDAAGHLVRVELYTAGDYTTLAEATCNGDCAASRAKRRTVSGCG